MSVCLSLSTEYLNKNLLDLVESWHTGILCSSLQHLAFEHCMHSCMLYDRTILDNKTVGCWRVDTCMAKSSLDDRPLMRYQFKFIMFSIIH